MHCLHCLASLAVWLSLHAKRTPGHDHCIPGIYFGPLPEGCKTKLLNFFGNAQTALHHQAQLPASPARHAFDQRRALGHQRLCPGDVGSDQCRSLKVELQPQQLRFLNRVHLSAVCGQVDAAIRNIPTQVLPKIDELQGRADAVALRKRCAVLHTVEVQQQPAHGVG